MISMLKCRNGLQKHTFLKFSLRIHSNIIDSYSNKCFFEGWLGLILAFQKNHLKC